MIEPRHEPFFWNKVQKTASCWLWTGYKNEKGYGKFTYGYAAEKRTVRAHRVSYELLKGPIPAGAHLDHTCHTKACVNPEHLRPVTNKQNQENRLGAQGNSATGVRGVFMGRSGKPYARVKHNQVNYNLGTFESIEEAAEAVKALRLQLFSHNDMDRKTA